MKNKFLAAVLLTLSATSSMAQQAPSEHETLEYLESALNACPDVDSVERSDINFRIYHSIANVYSEFNLADVSGGSYGILVVFKCGRGACIEQKMEHMGDWIDFKHQSSLVLNCGADSPKIGRALKYYAKHFANDEIDFPNN